MYSLLITIERCYFDVGKGIWPVKTVLESVECVNYGRN